ncbi:MAG: transposase [Candidatus Omnitrophota bacterium]|jgi:transposase
MIDNLIEERSVYVYRGVCDMRWSFDRLAMIVNERLEQDPRSGKVYVFLNRGQNKIKALYWDEDGYVLWHKRLESGQFPMPGGEGFKINAVGWKSMMAGVDVRTARRKRSYKKI